jgi:hypothetical protein
MNHLNSFQQVGNKSAEERAIGVWAAAAIHHIGAAA